MPQVPPTTSDQYRRYAELLLLHHARLCESASDDPLEAIEDEMTGLWDQLDAVEVATSRAVAWQALGFPEISEAFGAFAARIASSPAGVGVMSTSIETSSRLSDPTATTD